MALIAHIVASSMCVSARAFSRPFGQKLTMAWPAFLK
jgi:hypothetical protein